MNRPLSCALSALLLTVTHILYAQCPASTPLSINSVTTTESRCQASGTAVVSASGGSTPYVFSVIAGPTLTLPQTSNTIQSLAPGSYTVQVTDNCGTSVTKGFSVTGTYTVPLLVTTPQSPSCHGGTDGSIRIDVTNGRSPLQYSIISPSPVTRAPQTGNVFSGLSAGTYTCQVTDSCGNFQTRAVTILDGSTGSVTFYPGVLLYQACDSFAYVYSVYISTAPSNFKPPYTAILKMPDNTTITHILSTPADIAGNITDTFHFRFKHTTGVFDQLTLMVSNNCGASQTGSYPMFRDLDMSPVTIPLTGCGNQYAYTVDLKMDNNGSPSPVHCNTITYTLVSPAGVILTTQTNNSTFSGYPPANGYKVVRQDCCRKDTLVFDWAAVPPLKITTYIVYPNDVCKEGTTSIEIFFNNSTQGSIVIASGPPSVTFANGTIHTYTYPDTIKKLTFNPYGLSLGYFGAGTYKLYAIDSCGQKDSLTFTITPSQTRHSAFSSTLIKNCTGANKIMLNVRSNFTPSSIYPDGTIDINNAQSRNVISSPYIDSVINLSSGTYYVRYTYKYRFPLNYLNGTNSYGCDVITDTIVIPSYTQPVFDPSAAIAICGATREVALIADATRGIAPYQYQITTGPVTTPLQTSPVFPGLAAGTYTFLMEDACANSYSRSLTVDTLAVPDIITTGRTCTGGAATFTLPASPFYSYTWQHPDGSTSTGNALTIDPITTADLGTYTVSVTSTLGGCTNTSTKKMSLADCIALPVTLLNFTGTQTDGAIQLRWQTTDETNTGYYIVEKNADGEESGDGAHFIPLQRVDATGLAMNIYSVIDKHPPQNIAYYRLQIASKDERISYSKTISFNNGRTQKPDVYPRIITGNAPVIVTYPQNTQPAFVQVLSIDGKLWQTKQITPGSSQTTLDVTSLARGSYLVVFINPNNTPVTMQVWKQ